MASLSSSLPLDRICKLLFATESAPLFETLTDLGFPVDFYGKRCCDMSIVLDSEWISSGGEGLGEQFAASVSEYNRAARELRTECGLEENFCDEVCSSISMQGMTAADVLRQLLTESPTADEIEQMRDFITAFWERVLEGVLSRLNDEETWVSDLFREIEFGRDPSLDYEATNALGDMF